VKVYHGCGTVWNQPAYFTSVREYREPKKGEFYLSGAIPKVYRAENHLSSKYHIMKKYEPKADEIVQNGEIYVLMRREAYDVSRKATCQTQSGG